MKKITPQKLSKRLAQYGALSLAITGVADVSGQIIYTDINPDQTIIRGIYDLDMDNDGSREFSLKQVNNNNWIVPFSPSDGILGLSVAFNYPFALSTSAVISGGQTTWIQGDGYYQTLNYNSCYIQNPNVSNSDWCGVTDKFVGLRFDIDGSTHYGWARLDSAFTPSTGGFTIKDYAYNPNAGEQIKAGEGTPLGIDDNVFNKIKIVALNKSIALFNLPQQTNYKLFSLTGQSVLDGKIENNTYVIEANTLSSGVYIIELEDNNSKAIMRKKIVL